MSGLFGHRHGVLWIAGGLAITLAFRTVYVAALVNWGGRPRLGRAGLATIAVLAALACVVYGKNWTPLWIYVSAATGVILAASPTDGGGPCAGSSPSGSATSFSAGSPTTTRPTSSSSCCPSCSSASP